MGRRKRNHYYEMRNSLIYENVRRCVTRRLPTSEESLMTKSRWMENIIKIMREEKVYYTKERKKRKKFRNCMACQFWEWVVRSWHSELVAVAAVWRDRKVNFRTFQGWQEMINNLDLLIRKVEMSNTGIRRLPMLCCLLINDTRYI